VAALRRAAPFVLSGTVAVGLQPLTGGPFQAATWWWGIACAAVGLVIASWAMQSHRAVLETCGGLASLLGVGIVRDGAGGVASGYGPLVILPVFWFSLYGTRAQLRIVLVGAAVVLAGPLALVGGDRYPASAWRATLVTLCVGTMFGLATQRLRDDLARRSDEAELAVTRLREGLEAMPEPIARYEVVVDDAGRPYDLRCVFINAAAREMFGGDVTGELLSQRLAARDQLRSLRSWLTAMHAPAPVCFEMTSSTWRVGRIILLQLTPLSGGLMATWRDVNDERRIVTEFRQSAERWHVVAETAADATLVLDDALRVVSISDSLSALLGFSATDAVGHRALLAVHPDDRAAVEARLGSLAEPGQRATVEFRVHGHRDAADAVWVEGRATRLAGEDGPEVHVALRDITSVRRRHEQLDHAATHDPLTGLLNRTGLAASAAARAGSLTTALFIDLDGFKAINDTHGHAAGDHVLVEVARRLALEVRSEDVLARIGGDEFAVICTGGGAPIETLRRRLKLAVERPLVLADGHEVTVGASIGVGLGDGSAGLDDLLARADRAMYADKRAVGAR